MTRCGRCGKLIHHNYFPKLVLECRGAVLLSHDVYNYIEERFTLCVRCKNAFHRFMKCENDTKCADLEVGRAENG